MKNKLLSVIFCLLALVLLVGCENKTEPTKKRVNYESSQTQNGGSQSSNPTQGGGGATTTQGGGQQVTTTTQSGGGQATTTTQAAQTKTVVISQSAIGATEDPKASYTEHKVTIDGLGIYSYSILRDGYYQNKIISKSSPSVLMNTAGVTKVVKVEISIVFDTDNNNKTPSDGKYGQILIYGFNEAIKDNEAFHSANLTPVATIQVEAGKLTYSYEFTGNFKFFGIRAATRMLPIVEVKLTYVA